jgi:predicted esterase
VSGDAAAGAPRVLHVPVPRTARLWTLGDAATARATWLVLHGYGQLAERFVRHFAPVSDGRLIVAPEALSRFYLDTSRATEGPPRVGATWMTREDRLHEIGDYLGWLDRALETVGGEALLARAPLHVLAFSQGTATACRWLEHRARHGHAPAERLVLWGGGVPHDLDPAHGVALLRATPLTVVVGADDEFVTPTVLAEQERWLRERHVPYTFERYDGGHRLVAPVLRRVITGA